MADTDELEPSDSLKVQDEPKSSAAILAALEDSKDAFRDWQDICDQIDDIYSRRDRNGVINWPLSESWEDAELDLFWSSYEILKPAVYARAPKPAVATLFKDRRPVKEKTAELLERVSASSFERSSIDDVMIQIRDDLIFTNRGVMWLTYETDDGQKVCFEHLDRKDFRHERAKKWAEVGWVARRAWMTRRDMRKRFLKTSGDAYKNASISTDRNDRENGAADKSRKASVWEVWHKADKKVYWVAEGVDIMLDSSDPELKLREFFPCPRPAYGTLERRSLRPVPDYERYAAHFAKINTLTARIYLLLEKVKLKGLIPAGGDVGNAIEELIRADDDEILIPVPSASLQGEMGNFVQWMPLEQIANTIQGLIQARSQLIDDFYQLSGISDIMRGATEAEETLGAQQLKSQYGSVRVRQKIDELQRIARDAVRIAAEIIAEKFSQKNLIDMSQMEIPSKADIEKQIKDIEKSAEKELKELVKQAESMKDQIQDPQQAQAAQQKFQETQQQILSKYAPMLNEAQKQVPIEDVMKLLRDDKARGFAFEIEDGSTIWADEAQEKASRNEFMAAFSSTTQALQPLLMTGESGAALAGAMLKFQLAPYRAGRELDSMIDDWVDSVKNMPPQQNSDDSAELAKAQQQLAEAEMQKARAQMAKVEADSQLRQIELQRKMGEAQAKAQSDQQKLMLENGKLQLSVQKQQQDFETKIALMEAQIDKLRAETAKTLASIGLDVRKQDLAEYTAASNEQQKQVDTALKVGSEERANRGEERADRQQEASERQSDRQMELNERQAMEANDAD